LTRNLILDIITLPGFKRMNKAKLKVLLAALKEVVEELESEVYSDTESYMEKDPYGSSDLILDYDEVLGDDDGYPD
jgi:hypothetical protein|tara:strand:+ start:253 stop:480 length:228 start_codon:yes stop_codon:yes gene_type:complete